MMTYHFPTWRVFGPSPTRAAILFLVTFGPATAFAAPVVVNGSFEDNPAPSYPGYGAITGWSSSDLLRTGLNTAAGPFWDNGTNPHGTQVALIQSISNDPNHIAQNVAGFEAGKSYEIRMYANARNYLTWRPRARIAINGVVTTSTALINHVSNIVGGNTGTSFTLITSRFASPGTGTYELKIENPETRGDNSLIVDGVEIVEVGNIAPVASLGSTALRYNGTNTALEIARPVQGDFTIEFWFNSTQVNGGETFWYQGAPLVDGEMPGVVNDFGVTLGAGKVLFGVGNPDVTIKSGVVADGNWHHVAATREAATGAMRLYIDGVQVVTGSAGTQQLTAPTNLRVGASNYDGALDDVRIWSRTRSAAEIAQDYRRVLTGTEFGIVRYFKFDETTGTVAVDAGPAAANATISGTAAWTAGSAGVNQVATSRNTDVTIPLGGYDANGSALTATVTAIPAEGSLYQYNAGTRGAAITTPGTAVSDPQGRVIFAPDANETGSPYASFSYTVNDGTDNSQPFAVSVIVVSSLTAAADWQMFE